MKTSIQPEKKKVRTLDSNPTIQKVVSINDYLIGDKNKFEYPIKQVPIQMSAGYLKVIPTITSVTQLGRGNHLYNDLISHFVKHWIPLLKILCEQHEIDTVPLDSINKLLSGAKVSQYREYADDGTELYDGKTLSSTRTKGENEKRFGAICNTIDFLLNTLSKEKTLVSARQLLAILNRLLIHWDFFTVDSEMEVTGRNEEVISIFRLLVTIMISIIKQIHEFLLTDEPTSLFLDFEEFTEKKEEFKKAQIDIDLVLTSSFPSSVAAHSSSAKRAVTFKTRRELEAFVKDRQEFTEELREKLNDLPLIYTENCAGLCRLNPDEIPSDGNCFFNALLALHVPGAENINQLRNIAAKSGHDGITTFGVWAEERDIIAVANALKIRIIVTTYDLAYSRIQENCFGNSGPVFYLAQIFGGHFTPLRPVHL